MPFRELFNRKQSPETPDKGGFGSERDVRHFLEVALDISPEGICCVSADRRIMFWNKRAEEITGYVSHEAKGRFCYDHVLGHYDQDGSVMSHASCPITETLHSGQPTEKRAFAHHKDGYMIAIRLRTTPVRNEMAEIVGVVEAFQPDDDQSPHAVMDQVHNAATPVDQELAVPVSISEAVSRIRSRGNPAGLVLLRLENRQMLVNRYTQRAADQLVGLLEKTLESALSRVDAAARADADNFIIVISAADQQELDSMSDRIRHLTAGTTLQWWGSGIQFTASVGSAMLTGTMTASEALVSAAKSLEGIRGGARPALSREATGQPGGEK
jgi:PAS domain S-box-containing protein